MRANDIDIGVQRSGALALRAPRFGLAGRGENHGELHNRTALLRRLQTFIANVYGKVAFRVQRVAASVFAGRSGISFLVFSCRGPSEEHALWRSLLSRQCCAALDLM